MHQKDNLQSTGQQSIKCDPATVYFRCSNKIAYPLKLRSSINLSALKKSIAKDQKIPQQDLKFIYQGKQLQKIEDLQPRHLKCIVHVVNLPRVHQENLKITINFANKFKEDYKVRNDMKIQSLFDMIKEKHQLTKVVLIHLGTTLKPLKTFQQHMIEDRSSIYAPEIAEQLNIQLSQSILNNENIKQSIQTLPKTTVSNIESSEFIRGGESTKLFGSYPKGRVELKKAIKKSVSKPLLTLSQELQITETEKEDQSSQENKGKTEVNQLNIPISDIFDLHKYGNRSFRREHKSSIKEQNKQFLKPDLPRYQFIRSTAKNAENLLLSSVDFIFSGQEELPQTEKILSKFLSEMRPKHGKNKR